MEFFEIFFYWVRRGFPVVDWEICILQICTAWFAGVILAGSVIVLICFNSIVLIFRVVYAGVCVIGGHPYVEFPGPIFSVKRFNSYIDVLLNNFSTESVSRTEEFTPPFVFGYRKYFFARIVGWRGTWASFLKQYRRRIKSSIFEWGYRSRLPSWHYYTLRGGLRVQIVIPSYFRRVSAASYSSPTWFYSFPVRPKRFGFRGDEWDHYFHSPFRGQSNYKRLYRFYRGIERPKARYLYLSAWLDKCAPMMRPSYRKSTKYNSAIDPRSPYSYANFQVYFNNISKVSHRRPTHLGMEQAVLYVDTTAHEMLKPRVRRLFRKFIPDLKIPYLRTLLHRRKVGSIGDYILIDKEALKLKIFLVKYANYTTGPAREYNRDYDYAKFISLYWYHTFVEFLSIAFEGFYIYPFELEIAITRIIVVPGSDIVYFFDMLVEYLAESEFVFNNSVICFVGLVPYFLLNVIILQFVAVLVPRILKCIQTR